MINRRDFLKNTTFLAAGTLLAGKTSMVRASNASVARQQMTTAGKSFGLQDYSLQKELFNDFPARMKELKEMGYVYHELAGYNKGKIGAMDLSEFKKIAEDNGQKIVSSHVNPSVEGQPFLRKYTKDLIPQIMEFWKKAAEDHGKIGCNIIVQPMMPEIKTHEDAALVCDVFNQTGDVLKSAGISFGYHNHNMEFQRIVKPEDQNKKHNFFEKVGDQIYDLFLAGTDPSKVFFEMDVYWTVMGQNDPVEYMKKYADRIKMLHIKDRSVLGQSGMMNFEMIFKQMYANGITNDHFFVELEHMPDGRTQLEGIKDCAAYLQNSPYVK